MNPYRATIASLAILLISVLSSIAKLITSQFNRWSWTWLSTSFDISSIRRWTVIADKDISFLRFSISFLFLKSSNSESDHLIYSMSSFAL